MPWTSRIHISQWLWWPTWQKCLAVGISLACALLGSWLWTVFPYYEQKQAWESEEAMLRKENEKLSRLIIKDKLAVRSAKPQEELDRFLLNAKLDVRALRLVKKPEKTKQAGNESKEFEIETKGNINQTQNLLTQLRESNWHWQLKKLAIKTEEKGQVISHLELEAGDYLQKNKPQNIPRLARWQSSLFVQASKPKPSAPIHVAPTPSTPMVEKKQSTSQVMLDVVKLAPLGLVDIEPVKMNLRLLGIVEQSGQRQAVVKWEGKNYYLSKGDAIDASQIQVNDIEEKRIVVSLQNRKQIVGFERD